MAQMRRERGRRYRKVFADNPEAAALFLDEITTDDGDSDAEKVHRRAKTGVASNSYLAKVEVFFGLTVGPEGEEKGNGYLRC